MNNRTCARMLPLSVTVSEFICIYCYIPLTSEVLFRGMLVNNNIDNVEG